MNPNNSIRISELSSVLLNAEIGTSLCSSMEKVYSKFGSVTVDFSDTQFMSTAFLNHSLGQFCMNHKLEYENFFNIVQVTSLDEDGMDDIRLVVFNAVERWKSLESGYDLEQLYNVELPV
ncbi:MAG: STAS-like domain-containing protein [Candidatus Kapabacteria bacterium]|nr:STAS-like domain-containing protein [Candidatus Kapabacteria bacterium]MBX7155892.1 STAS-like domain-containing protein [Bacteroidota bacterium]